MKFSHVLGIAFILAFFAVMEKRLNPSTVLAILVLLLIGTFAPFIAVPIGGIAIIWLLYTDQHIKDWLTSFTKKGNNNG